MIKKYSLLYQKIILKVINNKDFKKIIKLTIFLNELDKFHPILLISLFEIIKSEPLHSQQLLDV